MAAIVPTQMKILTMAISPTIILLCNFFLASHCSYRSVKPIYKNNKPIFFNYNEFCTNEGQVACQNSRPSFFCFHRLRDEEIRRKDFDK